MKQKVIEDFLNIPGIDGLALVDGRSRPFFYGVDQGLSFQQKQVLAQGIQQVVETTLLPYQFFKFQFGGCQVYVHKLPQSLILLVLASQSLAHQEYLQAVNQLKTELQRDGASAVANFQTVIGQTTASSLQNMSRSPKSGIPTNNSTARTTLTSDISTANIPPRSNPASRKDQELDGTAAQPTAASSSVTLDEFLSAINALLSLSSEYLGKTMVLNYWKSSCPPTDWLSNFALSASGRLIVASTAQINVSKPLSQDQQQWLREWVNAYMERCSRIIRDFPKLLLHGELDSHQKTLLFPQT